MEPGDLVQVDTLDVRPLPGGILKHFTARDVVSRWDVVEVRTRATANTATDFLSTLQARMPFPVRAIQVDGGSEFQAGFELRPARSEAFASSYCHRALPSSMVPWNGHNVPMEFYEVNDFPLEIAPLNRQLRLWELTYNTVRPPRGPGLPYPTTVPPPAAISAKGARVSLIYWTSTVG